MNRERRPLRTFHLHAAFKLARQVMHQSQPEGVSVRNVDVAGYADAVILDHQEPVILRFRLQGYPDLPRLSLWKGIFKRVGDQLGEHQPTWDGGVDIHITLCPDVKGNATFWIVHAGEISDETLEICARVNAAEILRTMKS